MSFATRTWDRMTPPARVIAILVPLAVVLALLAAVGILVILPAVMDFLGANMPLVRFVVAVLGILLLTVPTAFVLIYMELKIIARMNLRIGPNRIGPWGSGMSLIHGFKVLSKEDFAPTGTDLAVFTLAPVITFLASVMTLLVIPFAPGIFGQDFNIGLLYFFAMGGLTVLGLLMGGWASFNKYSLLGGLRSAAQIVSYEIPLTISVIGIVLLAGTMSLNGIVLRQSGSALDWFAFKQPLGLLIFFIAATAEANRTPFDMTEADSEIVAGFGTEYSGMRYGFFYFAEYVNVFIVSALLTTLFFGGWTSPIAWPWPYNLDWVDASGIRILLIAAAVAVAFVVLADLVALVIWLFGRRNGWTFFPAFGLGVLASGAVITAVVGLAFFIAFDPVRAIFWFMAKTYFFVFVFVWMRATLPRVRVDQLTGFAWKWLLPASLVNVFLTATAIILLRG